MAVIGANWPQMTVEGATGEGRRLKRVELWRGRCIIKMYVLDFNLMAIKNAWIT